MTNLLIHRISMVSACDWKLIAVSKTELEKQKNAQEDRTRLTLTKKLDTIARELSKPLNNDLDDGTESHIVPLDPSQSYIARDFVRTNNTLNKSMTILKEQNNYLVEKVSSADPKDREAVLNIAAHEVRQNAHALAQIVQAKVAYIKAVKQ